VLKNYEPEIAFEMLGRDLVNLNVNDILVKGAKPLFFLDYFGGNKINSLNVKYFVKGICDACKELNCVLLGGEISEMPDVYVKDSYDFVGTMVGIIKENDIIDGKKNVKVNDIVIGLPSSGPHSNGFTLIRKIIDRYSKVYKISQNITNQLCATHKCYYNEIMLLKNNNIKINALCHISGGGFIDNPPRVIPDNMYIEWNENVNKLPEIFQFIKNKGMISDYDMKKNFNCGFGMLVILPESELDKIKLLLNYTILGKVH